MCKRLISLNKLLQIAKRTQNKHHVINLTAKVQTKIETFVNYKKKVHNKQIMSATTT